MLFKILEKYAKLKTELDAKQKAETEVIEEHDKEIIKNFLELYDKDVKKIHSNEEKIEKNLQALNEESFELQNLTTEAIQAYDNLVEYFKESGDLYNWCTILEKQMGDVQQIIAKASAPPIDKNNDETKLDN